MGFSQNFPHGMSHKESVNMQILIFYQAHMLDKCKLMPVSHKATRA